MDEPITTAQVPPQFLRAVFLVGHVPLRALSSDPRVSYALYIPEKHYNPDPSLSERGDHPSYALPKLPLLVHVHGTGRRTTALYGELVPFAESTPCAVLVPLFPAGLDGPNDTDSYKLLRSKTLRSDLALLSMLDEVAHRWPGIGTEKVFMMGVSGGGQFTHRFLYMYPERLRAASVGAPGRVTLLDDEQDWPRGVADAEALLGKPIRKDLIRAVGIQLVIGSEDVGVHGGKEFWEWARKRFKITDPEAAKRALPDMENGRLETLRRLKELWARDGIEARLDVVEGVGHDADGLRQCGLEFLQPYMQQTIQEKAMR
ncbi:Poly hydrolase [Pleurostoma richardsiae]|uniref:Poly hydrolase n=1 Tax=Pleurostoma richardsiae TaxID=41990 RepID=A0AA38RBQ7_9PEZI|nr:Poly hydrolase [Pleurostoma richardsiae]